MRVNRALFCDTLIVLCAILNAALLATRCWKAFSAHGWTTEKYEYTYIGDDYPEHLPFPSPPTPSKRVFDLSPTAFPISGPNAAEEWESIYPPGYGFVRMGDQARLLCIALFHQLHCIEKMRIYLDDPYGAGKWVSWPHQHHCMNYIRQAVLCRADRTLEPLGPDLEGELQNHLEDRPDGFKEFKKSFVEEIETKTGEAVERRCGDARALFDFAGHNYVEWKRGWNITSPWDEQKAEQRHTHGHKHM